MSLSVLVKPVSGMCNLQCRYCFYKEHDHGEGVCMSDSTAELLVKKALDYCDDRCYFLFQGGEPTLCGLKFYKNFVILVEKYNLNKIPVYYSLQTNGQLMNETWAEFFAKHNFNVGVSIDGTKEVHDFNRLKPDGTGSYDSAVYAIELLKRAGVEYSVVITVTDSLKSKYTEIYNQCINNGWNNIHIIPCISDKKSIRSLSAETYAEFLISLFNLWYEGIRNGQYISIRLFENYVSLLSGYGYEQCGLIGRCSQMMVVERDGTCYPCDFFVKEEMLLGSIVHNTIEEILERGIKIFLTKPAPRKFACSACQYQRICGGGCKVYRQTNGEYEWCLSTKQFFNKCFNRLMVLAKNETKLRKYAVKQ